MDRDGGDGLVAGLREVRAEAALMLHAPRLIPHHRLVLAATGLAGIPLASELRLFTAGGGLFSYGADWMEVERRRARLVARILDGASPGDIPIEQPTRFELVVNQQTAQRLGLPVPLAVLAFATEVI
jgi:putative ABC transport system substrate-binding protein